MHDTKKAYDSLEEFKLVTVDVLKDHPLAEYIAEQVYKCTKGTGSSKEPNVRDRVRIAKLAKTEQDVHRLLPVFRQ